MRIIDADELKKMFPDKGEGAWTYNINAKAYIDAQPTVDQWHYPSKGEYPKIGEKVLCKDCIGEYNVAEYQGNSVEGEPPWLFNDRISDDYVRAWQYIIPPKEEA